MSLAKKIKAFRKNRGLSQGQLAEETGLSRTFIHQLESGRSQRPSGQSLYRIGMALNVSMEDFFNTP